MRKNYFFKFFVFAVIAAFATITSCKDYDDDIKRIDQELASLKTSAVAQSDLAALKTQLENSIAAANDQITAAKGRLTELEGKVITGAQVDDKITAAITATKAEILAAVVSLETYNIFKNDVTMQLAALQTDVANAVTIEEVEALIKLYNSDVEDALLELDSKIANLDVLMAAVEGRLDGIDASLADQLAKIEANKTEIAAVKADLQTKYNELKGLIDGLRADLDNVTARLVAVEGDVATIKGQVTTIMGRLSDLNNLIIDVYAMLSHRVYTLTFIPDYTSQDGTPQIVVRGINEWRFKKPFYGDNFDEGWVDKSTGKIYKGITVLKYNVSPTNVSLTDFAIEKLLQKVSLVRSFDTKSDYIVLSGQASLANGVLSVPVAVQADDYDRNDGTWWSENGPNVSVALQVKNLRVNNGEADPLVTSTEYVKANFDLACGHIALNDNSLRPDGSLLTHRINYTEIASGSHISDIMLWNGKSYDGSMVDVLDHTINLNDYVYGVFTEYLSNHAEAKMLDFGFTNHKFEFRLVPLGNEGVDQSYDYLNFNGTTGEIGVKPYTGNVVNQAAVGRTPVVEVKAIVDGNVYAVGYMKILVTDTFDDDDVEFTFELEDFVLNCEATHGLTEVDIAAIDFDQVFNHPRVQLGKDAFFQEYRQNLLTNSSVTKVMPPTPATATVGIVGSNRHVMFQYNIDPQTQSTNLANYLEGTISNNAPAGDYVVKTRLRATGYRPDVVITWKFKVVLPEGVSLKPATEILLPGNPNYMNINPSVWGQVGVKSSTVYEALLNNSFAHHDYDYDFNIKQGTTVCDGLIHPYFVFTQAPVGFHVSADGTQILENGSDALAATITVDAQGRFTLKLNDETQFGPYTQRGRYIPYPAAVEMLASIESNGRKVMVQPLAYINNQPLNVISLYDPFVVNFVPPLKDFTLNLSRQTTTNVWNIGHLFDQGTGVNNTLVVTIDKQQIVRDFLDTSIRFGSTATQLDKDLFEHYELEKTDDAWIPGIHFGLGIDEITTDFSGAINGHLPTGVYEKLITSQSDQTLCEDGTVCYTKLVLEWHNSATGAIGSSFNIYIPVSLNHKWGTLKGTLTVTVRPGAS